MALMDRLNRIDKKARQGTSPQAPSTSSETSDFLNNLRGGFIETLQPFLVTGDSFSSTTFRVICRLVNQASERQLVEVLEAARHFVDRMEPYRNAFYDPDGNPEDTNTVGPSANGQPDTDGQSPTDRDDTIREINPGGFPGQSVLSEVLETARQDEDILSYLSDRHEAEMAGYQNGYGEINQ